MQNRPTQSGTSVQNPPANAGTGKDAGDGSAAADGNGDCLVAEQKTSPVRHPNSLAPTASENKKESRGGKPRLPGTTICAAATVTAQPAPSSAVPSVPIARSERSPSTTLQTGVAVSSKINGSSVTTGGSTTGTAALAAGAVTSTRVSAAGAAEPRTTASAEAADVSFAASSATAQATPKDPEDPLELANAALPVKAVMVAEATTATATSTRAATGGDDSPPATRSPFAAKATLGPSSASKSTIGSMSADSMPAEGPAAITSQAGPETAASAQAAAATVARMAVATTLRRATGDKPAAKGLEHQRNGGNPVLNSRQAENATPKTTQAKTVATPRANDPAPTAVPAVEDAGSTAQQGSNAHSRGEDENSHVPDAGKRQTPSTNAASGTTVAASGSSASTPTAVNHVTAPNSATAALNATGGAAMNQPHPATPAGQGGAPSTDFAPATIAAHRDAGPPAAADTGIAAVSNAQIIGRANQAEMRIQMQTETLGSLELRTWAAGNRVATTITAARPDTHCLLSNAVPALHQALSDHDLQVERIDIVWSGAGNAGNPAGNPTGGSHGGNSDSAANRQATSGSWSATAPAEQSPSAAEEATTSSAPGLYREGRLSVRV